MFSKKVMHAYPSLFCVSRLAHFQEKTRLLGGVITSFEEFAKQVVNMRVAYLEFGKCRFLWGGSVYMCTSHALCVCVCVCE
jgi:hypothetical protein